MADPEKTTDVPGYERRPGFLAARRSDEINGAVDRYEQHVDSERPPTRAEVEAQLRATSESISTRLESLQSEMGFNLEQIRSLASRPFVSVVLAAGAGILLGRLFAALRRPDHSPRQALVDLLVQAVLAAEDEGEPVDEAIERVLDVTELGESGSSDSGGVIRILGVFALRSVLRQIVAEIADHFRDDVAEAE